MKVFVFLQFIALISLTLSVIGVGNNLGWVFKLALFLAGLASIGAAIYFENKERNKDYELVFKNEENNPWKSQVKNHMKKYLENGGRCVIFTRDMSWATGDVKKVLQAKALNKELQIYMKESIDISQELSRLGAEVYYYGSVLDETIKTRFTIINAESHSVAVAIGRTADDAESHRIHTISDHQDPAFGLAVDMFALAKKTILDRENSSEAA